MDIYDFLYLIFEGYKKGKRLKKAYINQKEKEILFDKTLKFDVYDRKFILFLSLFVIYKYHPQNFRKFIEKLSESLENRKEYFKFKKLLKYPYDFIKKDLEYIIENHFEISEENLLQLYKKKKISMYSFYILLKDKNNGLVVNEIIKTIDYILQFLKVQIDENWYSSIKLKDDGLF